MRTRLTDDPGRMKTAASAGQRREIPDDFKYNPKKLKYLKQVLHNVSTSLGTLTSALNTFSRMKGPEISPDGLLGGVGYIIPIREIKQTLISEIHSLSNIADCLADELTNPRWGIKDDSEVKKLIEEKEEVMEKVDEEISPDDLVNTVEDDDKGDEEEKVIDTKELKMASAVKKSLLNFFENK